MNELNENSSPIIPPAEQPDLLIPMPEKEKHKKPKKRKGKIVLIVILILIVLGMSGYLVYDKFIKEEPKETEKKEEIKKEGPKVTSLDVTSVEVTSLYNNVDVFGKLFDSEDYYAYLYRTDSLNAGDMPDDVISLAGLTNALKECESTCVTEMNDGGTKTSVPRTLVSNHVKKVFGDIEYQDTSIKRLDCGKKSITYNGNTQAYENIAYGCGYGGDTINKLETKIIKAEKTDKEINIYVKVAFESFVFEDGNDVSTVGSNSYNLIYSDYMKQNQVAKIVDSDESAKTNLFNTYSDKLPTYKLTFTKTEENYYFTKVKKTK